MGGHAVIYGLDMILNRVYIYARGVMSPKVSVPFILFVSPFTLMCCPIITFKLIRYVVKNQRFHYYAPQNNNKTHFIPPETFAYIIFHRCSYWHAKKCAHKYALPGHLMQHTNMDPIDRIAGPYINNWTSHTQALIYWICSAWVIISALDVLLIKFSQTKYLLLQLCFWDFDYNGKLKRYSKFSSISKFLLWIN